MGKFVPTWRLVIWIVLGLGALAVGNIVYTDRAIRAEREGSISRQCRGIQDEIDFYVQNPPETPRQVSAQEYWLNRYDDVCIEGRQAP